ncbi:MAG: hypothetical protein ACOX1W_00225 [Catenisphaera adipataccumulans]|jgi:hypothetical protein|uniref:hypothetical protein n=1 Tax=Catenisphaera adipataccumulans TaxID=700500 RepID=UPI003D8F71B9
MSVTTHVKAFWEHFLTKEEQIRTDLAEQNYESLNQIIETLDEEVSEMTGARFFVESGYDDYEMTFDTGPNKTTQYLCEYVKALAPESVKKGWIINSCLPPMSQKAIQACLKIKEYEYYINDFYVFYEINEKNQSLEAELYCPGYHLIGNDERKKEMSMYLIETAIGECAYEAYLSRIDSIDEPKQDAKFCNLIDFYETIMKIVEQKDWRTYDRPIDIYSVYQPIQDFASDSLRKDMKFIFTTHPLLIEETIENKNDVLSDLKAKGGEYGYIYYNNLFRSKEDAVFRQKLSKKLDRTFTETQTANVIGGAIGKSYSYIDCIVYDKKRFVQIWKQIQTQIKEVDLHYLQF